LYNEICTLTDKPLNVQLKCLLIHLNFEAIKLNIKTEDQNVHLKEASHPKPDQTLKPNHLKIRK